MARMHSRRKGKAGSTYPVNATHPDWCPLTVSEIDERIVSLANAGNHAAQIGSLLRDRYGVPSVKLATGKRVMDILKEHNLQRQIPEDLRFLIQKALRVRKHLETNKKDLHNNRRMRLVEQKIHRLSKYYKSKGILDTKWRYRPETAAILLR